MSPIHRLCNTCGRSILSYTTTQNKCHECLRSAMKPQKPRKAITTKGKHAKLWEGFRDTVAKPYLDGRYGHVCSVKDCHETEQLDVDHIKPRGSNPHLRYDVKNVRYLCRAHHIQVTGVPRWTQKETI